jgi:hypothetical protein
VSPYISVRHNVSEVTQSNDQIEPESSQTLDNSSDAPPDDHKNAKASSNQATLR